jgi:hypothetical protein
LFGGASAVFALTNVMNFFANELAGLGARRFPLTLGFFRSLDSLFSRHASSSSYCESGCGDSQHNLVETIGAINVPVRDEKTALWNQRPDPPEVCDVKLFRVQGCWAKVRAHEQQKLACYCPAAETVWPLLRSLGRFSRMHGKHAQSLLRL